jgi:hypothetical protein
MSTSLEAAATKRHTFLEELESRALWFALAAALIQAATTFIFNPGANGLPLAGSPDSMAIRSLLAAIVISLVVGSYSYVWGMRSRNEVLLEEFQQDYRWSVVPMALAAVVMSAMTIAWLFAILNRAFPGATFNRVSMTLFLSIVSSTIAYIVAVYMGRLHAADMLYLGVIFLFGTLLFAGARNEDPYWWEYSFSHLGMTPSNSKSIFNIGLIFTGALIVIWSQFFMRDVAVLERRGLISHRTFQILNLSLFLTGIMLGTVGLIRFGIAPIFNLIHDVAATGSGVILGLLMLSMWWLNPHYGRVFYYVSVLIVVGMIGTLLANVMGYLTLTGLEFGCFVLASIWLVLFFQNTQLLIARVAPESLAMRLR